MPNQPYPKISRAGAYLIKGAESHPSRPPRQVSKTDGRISVPSAEDKRLAQALLKHKRA